MLRNSPAEKVCYLSCGNAQRLTFKETITNLLPAINIYAGPSAGRWGGQTALFRVRRGRRA